VAERVSTVPSRHAKHPAIEFDALAGRIVDDVSYARSGGLPIFAISATWVLVLVARPYTSWRAALVVAMGGMLRARRRRTFAGHFFALDLSNAADDAVAFACAAAAAAIITAVYIRQEQPLASLRHHVWAVLNAGPMAPAVDLRPCCATVPEEEGRWHVLQPRCGDRRAI
jgi:hypothetical protein